MWTDSEEDILSEYFSHISTDILADEFLPKKSKCAINSKARRENMTGCRDPHIQHISSLYKARKIQPTVTEEFKEFLWGLTLSDGTFVKTNRKDREGYKFMFSIEMVEENLLDEVRDTLKIGSVCSSKKSTENHYDTKIWQVSSIGEISEILVPLFDSIDGNNWSKYGKYIKWRNQFYEYYDIPYCRSKLTESVHHNSTWTAEEKELLNNLYPYLSSDKLEYIFERNQHTIQKKASMEGITKIDRFTLVKNISEYDDSDFYHNLLDNIQFVVGYLSGDGSFSNTNGRYRVSIASSSQNSKQLQELADLMGGYPKLQVEDKSRKEQWTRSAQLQISQTPFLLCTLIPVLETAEWYSASKERQFKEWKEGLHNKVGIDTLWEQVESHNRAKQKYNRLVSDCQDGN